MILAQKLHSETEMEANRIEFYKRFAKDQPYLTYEPTYEESTVVVEPISAITCENYLESEKRGRVKIDCRACRNQSICLTAT